MSNGHLADLGAIIDDLDSLGRLVRVRSEVDPAFGTWNDVERIAGEFDLCLDLTINHISDASAEFQDFLQHGYKSEHADLFVHVDQMGDITPDDMAKIHIRKEKEPFRDIRFADGTTGRVWCTFTADYTIFATRYDDVFFLTVGVLELVTPPALRLLCPTVVFAA